MINTTVCLLGNFVTDDARFRHVCSSRHACWFSAQLWKNTCLPPAAMCHQVCHYFGFWNWTRQPAKTTRNNDGLHFATMFTSDDLASTGEKYDWSWLAKLVTKMQQLCVNHQLYFNKQTAKVYMWMYSRKPIDFNDVSTTAKSRQHYTQESAPSTGNCLSQFFVRNWTRNLANTTRNDDGFILALHLHQMI